MWNWGSEQQAAFEKVNIQLKQIKVVGVSQAGLPFELDVSVILEGMGLAPWQRQQKERIPIGFWF